MGPSISVLWRRCATLPHSSGCSTIAVLGLSFRVRNGTGRLPQAMTAANLLFCRSLFEGSGVSWRFGDRMADACFVFDRLWLSVLLPQAVYAVGLMPPPFHEGGCCVVFDH